MSLHRRNPARDHNEGRIRAALRTAGWKVWPLSGAGVPDLLCIRRRCIALVECESRGGTLTKAQENFHTTAKAEGFPGVHIVYTVQDLREAGLL